MSKSRQARGGPGNAAPAPKQWLVHKAGLVAGWCLTRAAHLVHAVEVAHVLLHNVVGGDVGAAAKPPLAGDALPVLSLKVAAGEAGVRRQRA